MEQCWTERGSGIGGEQVSCVAPTSLARGATGCFYKPLPEMTLDRAIAGISEASLRAVCDGMASLWLLKRAVCDGRASLWLLTAHRACRFADDGWSGTAWHFLLAHVIGRGWDPPSVTLLSGGRTRLCPIHPSCSCFLCVSIKMCKQTVYFTAC